MGDNPFKDGIIDLEENDNNNYEDNTGNELIDFFDEPKEFNLKIDIDKNFKELNPIFEILIEKLNKLEEIYKGNNKFKGKDIMIKEIARNIGEIEEKLKKNHNDFKQISMSS